MLNKNTYIKTNYFLDYDLINKYNLLDLTTKPSLDCIKLNISLNNFSNLVYNNKSQSNSKKKINIFKKFVYFLSYYFTPYLFNIKIKKGISKKKTSITNCYLQLIIKNKSKIHLFLMSFLIENLTIIKEFKNFFLNLNDLSPIQRLTNDTFFITKTISTNFFIDLNYYISTLISSIYLTDLLINFCFIFKKNKKILLKFSNSFIQNLFIFWI